MPDVFRFIRKCPNGRLESQCRTCGNLFWLTAAELLRWAHCPHCFSWWSLPGDPRSLPIPAWPCDA